MNTLKHTLLLSGAFALSAMAADEVQIDGAKPGHWTMDFDAAAETAKEKKLPILVNFTGSDWCGWCKLMDKQVFAEKEWKEFAADNAMLVTIDFPRDKSIVPDKYTDRNKKLQEKYGVGGFPTYIILDSDGETPIGKLGASREASPSSFIKDFKNVVRLSEANVEAYIKANPDKAEAFKAAIAEKKEAESELKEWLETRPERNDENMKIFEGHQERIAKAEEQLAEFE